MYIHAHTCNNNIYVYIYINTFYMLLFMRCECMHVLHMFGQHIAKTSSHGFKATRLPQNVPSILPHGQKIPGKKKRSKKGPWKKNAYENVRFNGVIDRNKYDHFSNLESFPTDSGWVYLRICNDNGLTTTPFLCFPNSSKSAGLPGYHSATWPSGEVTKKQHAGAETFSGHRQALMKFFWELSCRRCRLGSPFENISTLSDAKSYMWVYMWIMNYESGLTQKFSVNKMILGLSSPISFLTNQM